MKFTVDLEEKKILIHGSFNRKDIDNLFSLLKIEDMDDWTIDKYESTPTWTNPWMITPDTIINPPVINPYNPPFFTTTCSASGHSTVSQTDIEHRFTYTNNTSGLPLSMAYDLIEG
jgi:hypothetical protein